MARDQDPRTSRLYDRRTVERSIKKGLLSRKDYEKHLKSLDDVAEKGVYGSDDTDDDDDVDEVDEADTATDAGDTGAPTNNQGH